MIDLGAEMAEKVKRNSLIALAIAEMVSLKIFRTLNR